MQTAQFPLPSSVEIMTAQNCAARLLRDTGPMLACVWPDLASWLDDLVPELADDAGGLPSPAYRLTQQQRRRMLSPEFDEVYPVADVVFLSRLIMAAVRHSELSVVFAPADVSRGKFAGLLRLADRTSFRAVDPGAPLRTDWLLDVGSYDADEKIIRIFAERADRLSQLTQLLSPLSLDRAPPSEGATP